MMLSRRTCLWTAVAGVFAAACVLLSGSSDGLADAVAAGSPPPATAAAADRPLTRPIVVAYERHHADASSAAAGRLLISELSCTVCHAANPADNLPAKAGPVLDGVGGRVSAQWLREFLADPQAAKPGTTMPHMLGALPPANRAAAVESLVHLLASSTKPLGKPVKLPANAASDRGAVLFHEIGCVACHAPEPDYRPPGNLAAIPDRPEAMSAPLPDLKQKYALESLMQFLSDPLAHRPAGRMPDLQLDPQDAVDIAGYLIGWTQVQTARSGLPTKVPAFKADPNRVDEGRRLFQSLNCAACHQLGTNKPSKQAAPMGSLANLDRGCTATKPVAGLPHFPLSQLQRQSIALAARPATAPPPAAAKVAATLGRLNCYACHRRDDRGGPDATLERYLTGDPDLADEGRFPPALTGVGRKLTPGWLAKVLGKEGRVRPYLRTRMPVFAADAVRHLPADLIAADGGMKADADKLFKDGDVEAGRLLLGGNGLSCITCHALSDKPAIGIHAMTLSGTPDRLQPDWFRQNLLNPATLRPGTLMPTFWPDGKAANDSILHGDSEKQIASIWAYLRDGKTPPDGYPPARGEFELVAADKPILLRCFMKDAGTHAIAVGFPQKVHVAFDADAVRPAIAWRGRFLDAYSTWFSRTQPPVEPLGDDVTPMPLGMPLARLATPNAAWPKETGADAGYRFKGYRLDQDGVPTFLYSLAGATIEDRLSPTEDGRGLRRTLVVRGVGKDLYCNPGVSRGMTVTLHQAGLSEPVGPRPLRFDSGVATLTLEYRW